MMNRAITGPLPGTHPVKSQLMPQGRAANPNQATVTDSMKGYVTTFLMRRALQSDTHTEFANSGAVLKLQWPWRGRLPL